jgi:hypothetical protein
MGETSDRYYEGLIEELKSAMDEFDGTVALAHVYYQKILQDNEDTVWERMEGEGLNYKDLRKFLLYGFADAAGLETRKEEPESPYALAQVEVARELLLLHRKLSPNGPVVVIAQSLGGQLFSSYLYDAQKSQAGRMPSAGIWKDIHRYSSLIKDDGKDLTATEIAFLSGRNVVGLLTTGCNIPIFVAAHKEMHIVPIEKPSAQFDWINLYDEDDVLGWPLGPLNNRYKALVVDKKINANGRGPIDYILGATPQSHTLYWDDKDVIHALRGMLRKGINKVVGAPVKVELDGGD